MKYVYLFFLFVCPHIFSEDAILLYYSQPKNVEIEHQYFLDLDFMKMDGKTYLLEFKDHSDLCPCENNKYEIIECPDINLPRKTPILFIQGHLQHVRIYKNPNLFLSD